MVNIKKAKKNNGKKTSAGKSVKKKAGMVKSKSVIRKVKKTISKKSAKKPPLKKKLKKTIAKVIKKKSGQQVKKVVNKVKVVDKKILKKVSKPLAPKVKGKVLGKSIVKQLPDLKKSLINNKKDLKSSNIVPSKKQQVIKGKPVLLNPKLKIDTEEKLHSKTQRIMKELEETMDLEKVKPRIKVPNFIAPKSRVAPVLRLIEPVNTKKEKYQLEFEFRSSKSILFSYLSDSSGMAGWFADEVRSRDNNYTFVWDGSETHAKLVAVKDQLLVRFEWTDENDGTYFQFEIREDDITSDIALMITDWAIPGEKEANARLWESQVQDLRQLIGSV